MAEIIVDCLVADEGVDEVYAVQRWTVDITPIDDTYEAYVLRVDGCEFSAGKLVSTSTIWNSGYHSFTPPSWISWWLRDWLKSKSAQHIIEMLMAHHDEFLEQRRDAERENVALLSDYRRAAL